MSTITQNMGTRSIESHNGSLTQGTFRKFTISAELELVIDLEHLAKVKGYSALLAKSGRTTIADGAIVIRIKPGTRIETPLPLGGKDGGQ